MIVTWLDACTIHCTIVYKWICFFLQLFRLMLNLVGVQLKRTVCGESSALPLMQALFSLLIVQGKGTQLPLAWPTGYVCMCLV